MYFQITTTEPKYIKVAWTWCPLRLVAHRRLIDGTFDKL